MGHELEPAFPAEGLVVHQPKRGFRYGSEAFWVVGAALAWRRPRAALDLGTGSGVMALLLAAHGVDAVGVDVRPEWSVAWSRSLRDSRSGLPIRFERADVRDVTAQVDLVVCNPPYFPAASGPQSADPWKAAARTESTATLRDFAATATRCLTPDGLAVFVIPQEREQELMQHMMLERIVLIGRRLLLAFARPHPHERCRRDAWAQDDAQLQAWTALARAVH